MTTTDPAPTSSRSATPHPAATGEGLPSLKPGSIGAPGIVFMVVAVAAPLTALASNIAISLAFGVGPATVVIFVVVGIVLGIFAVGYLKLAGYVRSAGGQSALVSYGMGRPAGTAVACIALLAYTIAAAGMSAATGLFASATVESWWGVQIPWYVYTAGVLVLMAVLAHRGVGAAEKAALVVSLLQFGFLALLAIMVLVKNPDGWSLAAFDPTRVVDGDLVITLIFVLLCYAGFEATTIYSEEARNGYRDVRRATYVGLVALALIFILSTMTLVAAHDDVSAAASADPGAIVANTAATYLGSWSLGVVYALVTASFFGGVVAFHNMAVRYQFALGRAGVLPAFLTRTVGERRTPVASSFTQLVLCVLLLLPFAVARADVLATLFPAASGITSLALLIMMVAASLGVVVGRIRGKVRGSAWVTVVAPVVSVFTLCAFGLLIATSYSDVTGSTSPVVAAAPSVLLVVAVYGAWRQTRLKHSRGMEHQAGAAEHWAE